jgi:hypothetical protein
VEITCTILSFSLLGEILLRKKNEAIALSEWFKR